LICLARVGEINRDWSSSLEVSMLVSLLGLALAGGVLGGESQVVKLPPPQTKGAVSVEEALAKRRSVRKFTARDLTWEQIGQLLWSMQGITGGDGLRTTPSAGALYPLEIYVATAAGLYRYRPEIHQLIQVGTRDVRRDLREAALHQEAMDASAVFAIAAVPERTRRRYAARTDRYVWMEAGHAAQNLLLQAVTLGLGAVPVGAFNDQRVGALLSLRADEVPLYLIPVGRPSQ
jgi:SagB-type dehydrogenase family enzyme